MIYPTTIQSATMISTHYSLESASFSHFRQNQSRMNSAKSTFFRFSFLLMLGLLALTQAGCTDDVTIASTFEGPQPVVDAWLTIDSAPQTIRISQTQDYYANTLTPGIAGAEVSICKTNDPSTCFEFVDQGNGDYVWTPASFGESLATVGDDLTLTVELPADAPGSGNVIKTLTAQTQVFRTAPIDSISFQFEESGLGNDEGIYGQVFARDLVGPGDRYLIRSQVNDTALNRIEELNLAFDAAFDGGTTTDGITFILPLRTSINKLRDDGSPEPLVSGDTMRVEIWSLSAIAFNFLRQASIQIQSGDSQLFSTPVVNVVGNVTDQATGAAEIGMFNVSAVSRAENVVP